MRGVTLEEISVATRIAPRFLAALENEQWELLPGGVFNRGFIRSVARYLGLDEDSLVAEYALETRGRSDPGVVADPPEEPDRNWARVLVVVLLVLVVLAGGWAAVHFLGPKIAARLHKHSGEPVNSAPAAGGGSDASASGTAPPLDLKLEAALAADVKVVADGKPVFQGHMDARQVYRFTAMESLQVSSNDSSSIVLELNGQAIASGGQPGQPGSVTLTQKDLQPAAGDSH